MGNNNGIVPLANVERESGYLQIPIHHKDLGDFITSLLGQPESITHYISGSFDIDLEWFKNIHHLLEQRIKQQNSAELVDFSATFSYEGSSSRKINSSSVFLHYLESRNVRTRSVKIVWTYLITFPTKNTPEKQEITLNVSKGMRGVVSNDGRALNYATSNNSIIGFNIDHTERTWGDDIDSLLYKEIENVVKKDDTFKKILSKVTPAIYLLIAAISIILPEFIETLLQKKQMVILLSELHQAKEATAELNINDKLNIILNIINPENALYNVGLTYRLLSVSLGVIFIVLISQLSDIQEPSFICITSADKKAKKDTETKRFRVFLRSFGGFIFAISAGVIGNYAYYYLNLP